MGRVYRRTLYPGTWAQRTPDRPALVMADSARTLTHRELDERSLRLAHVLRDAGLRDGAVVAFVQPAPGVDAGPALAAELTAYARDRIAHFKVPAELLFREQLPRTPTGKMVQGRLREEYAAAGQP